MSNRAELEAAAAAGVISAEQANKLGAFLQSRTSGAAAPLSGEEDFRFIRNFHDLFLAIGIVLFAVGLAVGIGAFMATQSSSSEQGASAAVLGGLCAGAAAAMWGLGEMFARRRRLFLPAIATVISFTLFVVAATVSLYFGLLVGRGVNLSSDLGEGIPPSIQIGLLLSAAMAFIAPGAFYARFRLPFSMGMAGGGVALFLIACTMVFAFDHAVRYLPALYLVLGLGLFAAGVAFDARDPMRVSRMSDNGFWLHFAAAPLILNGSFGLLNQATLKSATGFMGGAGGLIMANASDANAASLATATLLVVVVLGLVSLLINRRVLIVSALLTTGVAIGVLLDKLGLGAGGLAAATLIVLGAFVLILGAGWHSVRLALLGWVKPGGAWARIFPPEAAA